MENTNINNELLDSEDIDILSEFKLIQENNLLQHEKELAELSKKSEILEIEEEKKPLENELVLEKEPEIENIIIKEEKKEEKKVEISQKKSKFFGFSIFVFKYILTSCLIFLVLLVSTNYVSYGNIIKSYLFSEELAQEKNSIINSVKASYVEEKQNTETGETVENEKISSHSIKSLIKQSNNEDINLKIDITPYENRIVIPKIGKNVPLLDIKDKSISGEKELNNIFMKELENGVIRYPGSVKPGEDGTTFIFGHSSNYPWIKGDYNNVFALLDKVTYNDEIIIYYGQKQFKYKIREKKVVMPGDVSILKRDHKKSELTLMTCWPIGTTLKRLVVTGDLVE